MNDRIVHVHFARKPVDLEAALLDHDHEIERAWIEAKQPMTTAEYDAFATRFLADHAWLINRGGAGPNRTTRVIEVSAPNRRTLYINPEGYSYARYVGFDAAE